MTNSPVTYVAAVRLQHALENIHCSLKSSPQHSHNVQSYQGRRKQKTVLDAAQPMNMTKLGLGHLRQDIKKTKIQRERDA